jgi:hypothetical protein
MKYVRGVLNFRGVIDTAETIPALTLTPHHRNHLRGVIDSAETISVVSLIQQKPFPRCRGSLVEGLGGFD